MDLKHISAIIITLGAIGLITVIAMGSHDIQIVTDNYRNHVKQSLNEDNCDEYKSNFHYGQYVKVKDLFLKQMTDSVIVEEVKLKMIKCGDYDEN